VTRAPWSLVVVVLVCVAVLVGGCSTEPSFGRRCGDDSGCGEDAPVCVDDRCVPVRAATDAGGSCAEPVPWRAPDGGDDAVLLRAASTFGDAARVTPATGCDAPGTHSVVFALNLDDDSGVEVTVNATFAVSVELRRARDGACDDDGACGERSSCRDDDDGCSATVRVPRLAAGTWAVVVHGTPPAGDPGRFVVTATRIDCPVGYVPFDEATCVGFRPVAPLPFAVDNPSVALVDGLAVFTDEQPPDSVKPGLQVFDPRTEQWAMRDFEASVSLTAVVASVEGGGLVVGNDDSGSMDVWHLSTASGLRLQQFSRVDSYDRALEVRPSLIASGPDTFVVHPSSSDGSFLLVASAPPCAVGCPPGFVCVDPIGSPIDRAPVCICIDRDCEAQSPLSLFPSAVPAVSAAGRAIGIPAAEPAGLTFVHGFDRSEPPERPLAAFVHGRIESVAAVTVAERSSVTLGALPGVAIVAGGLVDDAPSALVEFVDAATLAVTSTALDRALVRPAVAPFAGMVAVLGGCLDRDCAAPSSATSFLSPSTPAVAGPQVPWSPVALVAVALDADRALVIDGEGRSAALLERVPRGFRAAPRDRSGECPVTTTVSLPVDGTTVTVTGTVVSQQDRLRTLRCEVSDADRVEAVLAVTLAADADVEITLASLNLSDDAYRFNLWAFTGDCALKRNDLACADSQAGVLPALSLAAVNAGTLYVVVEAQDFDAAEPERPFLPFELQLRAQPVQASCTPDAADPGDDDEQGARPLSVSEDLEGDDWVALGEGVLCAGDVDQRLYQHGGGPLDVLLTGLSPSALVVRAATLDEPASASAGQAVIAAVASASLALDDELARGAYVLTLSAPPEATAATTTRWRLAVQSGCTLDEGDSLVAALDDRSRPAGPPATGAELATRRSLCFPTDADVIPLPDWSGERRLLVEVDGQFDSDIDVAVHGLTADGRPGPPIGTATVERLAFSVRLVAEGGPTGPTALVIGPSPSEHDDVQVTIAIQGERGDRCTSALPLTGDGGEEAVTLFGRADDVDVDQIGACTGYSSTGPDAFYALALAAGEGATLTATPVGQGNEPSTTDISLYAFTGCPPAANACVAGSDRGFGGDAETITVPPAGAARTIFVGVDSYYEEPTDVRLTWSRTR